MQQFLLIYYNKSNERAIKWFSTEKEMKKVVDEYYDNKVEIICALEVKRFI